MTGRVLVFRDRVELLLGKQVALRLSGKWASLYGTLALSGGHSLDQHAVCALAHWPEDPMAAGREIARHMKSKRVAGLPIPFLLSDNPTKNWRQNPDFAIETPGEDAAKLLNGFQKTQSLLIDVLQKSYCSDAFCIAEAQLLFHQGHLRRCHSAAYTIAQSTHHPELKVIAAFWSWQSAMRLPPEDALLDEAEHCEEIMNAAPHSPISEYMKDRYRALAAYFSPPHEWPARLRKLDTVARTPKQSRDLSNWAYANNYAALLHRRQGNLRVAKERIAVTIAPALACGDMYFIQAVLFNLGIILCDVAGELVQGSASKEIRINGIMALELDKRVTTVLGVGKNTAANEIFIAEMHIANGEQDAAEEMIHHARELVSVNQNALDVADLRLCEANFTFRFANNQAPSLFRALLYYEQAEELFRQCNRDDRARFASKKRQSAAEAFEKLRIAKDMPRT